MNHSEEMICGYFIEGTNIPVYRDFEESLQEMKDDNFKKKYPFWSNIDNVAIKVKSGIKILNVN